MSPTALMLNKLLPISSTKSFKPRNVAACFFFSLNWTLYFSLIRQYLFDFVKHLLRCFSDKFCITFGINGKVCTFHQCFTIFHRCSRNRFGFGNPNIVPGINILHQYPEGLFAMCAWVIFFFLRKKLVQKKKKTFGYVPHVWSR